MTINEEIDTLKEPINELLKMLKEDLSKKVNQDLTLNVGGHRFNKETFEKEKLSDEETTELLRDIYFRLVEIFDFYMDDTPENISFYAIWLLGTYFHNQFTSYPYLFLNAMRGSGKSRLLKLLAVLGGGRYTSSITEAVVFRTCGLLCIDELESIGGKDKANLREILNASYKKGMTIMRTIKKKDITGDVQKIEEFECYRPIALANIWGMEEVLGDRCITRILEKSDNMIKTRIIEDYEHDPKIIEVCKMLKKCSLCGVEMKKKLLTWNTYIISTNYIYTYYNTNNTNNNIEEKDKIMFEKIEKTGIYGRNLELFFPILLLAEKIGDDVFEVVTNIAEKLNNEKKDNEASESVDVMVYDFISTMQGGFLNYYKMKELFNNFQFFTNLNDDWVNIKWFGRALKRLNLVLDKRRKNFGIEVTLNVAKAKEKMKMFKGKNNDEQQ